MTAITGHNPGAHLKCHAQKLGFNASPSSALAPARKKTSDPVEAPPDVGLI
jgi:hypothetical protein